MTADEIVRALGLEPLVFEGGLYRETWRAAIPVATSRGPRSAGTAIYYLLTPGQVSRMHRLAFDEVFHFYLGDPVEMLLLHPAGHGAVHTLGPDLGAGMRPQLVVPADVWQGARLADGGRVALLGTTVAPGFDPADFEIGERATLLAGWPAFGPALERLLA